MPAFDIPNGPKNLSALFPSVVFTDVEEYYVQLKSSGGTIVATTTRNWISGCCGDEKVRLFFFNASGRMDAINAKFISEDLDVKSDSYKKGLPTTFNRTAGGSFRNNIQAGLVRKLVITDIEEKDMRWITELFSSPFVWVEDTVNDNYLPVVIVDGKLPTLKEEDRYDYQTELTIRFSNDLIKQRS